MALEEMLFITSHQVRKPVANILGLAELLDAETEQMSAEELRTHCRYLKSSADELDDIVKTLNISWNKQTNCNVFHLMRIQTRNVRLHLFLVTKCGCSFYVH